MRVSDLQSKLSDVLFPQIHCIACGEKRPLHQGLCASCESSLLFLRAPKLSYMPGIDAGVCLYPYKGAVREMIRRFKFLSQYDLPIKYLTPKLAGALRDSGLSAEVIVPVPTNLTHLYARGYDHTFLLAKALGRELGLPVCRYALRRKQLGRHQTGLSAADRYRNAELQYGRGFWIDGVIGKRVLLVDDVSTTGATASACARALLALGAEKVYLCCLAKTERDRDPAGNR